MAENQIAEFKIKCKGRYADRREVLKEPIEVKVIMYLLENESTIASHVEECPHNTGGHGQRCKSSHPGIDKVGEGIRCPYSFDVPHCFDQIPYSFDKTP